MAYCASCSCYWLEKIDVDLGPQHDFPFQRDTLDIEDSSPNERSTMRSCGAEMLSELASDRMRCCRPCVKSTGWSSIRVLSFESSRHQTKIL